MKEVNIKRTELKRLVKLLNGYDLNSAARSAEYWRNLRRVHALVEEVKNVLTRRELRRILGSLVMVLGLGSLNGVQAQQFAAPQINPFGLTAFVGEYAFPAFADLDDDGDFDLVVGDLYGNINFYQNTGTTVSPLFTMPVQNPFSFTQGYSIMCPTLGDLDNDGDLDILVGAYYGDLIYYENIGTPQMPQFTAPVISPFGLPVQPYWFSLPDFVDIDDDGDLDVMIHGYDGTAQFVFYENIGTANVPTFTAGVSNPFGLSPAGIWSAPEFADIDADGDFDMFITEYYGELIFFENTGGSSSPSFAAQVINPFGFVADGYMGSTTFCDLDADSDQDLLIARYEGDLRYFENDGIGAINELDVTVNIFPNPASSRVQIQADKPVKNICLNNLAGSEVELHHINGTLYQIPEVSNGLYCVVIIYHDGSKSQHKITVTN